MTEKFTAGAYICRKKDKKVGKVAVINTIHRPPTVYIDWLTPDHDFMMSNRGLEYQHSCRLLTDAEIIMALLAI